MKVKEQLVTPLELMLGPLLWQLKLLVDLVMVVEMHLVMLVKATRTKGKKGLYVVIVESQVMLLRSATNFMAIPLAIRERESIQWLFKLEVLILGS